MIRNLNIMTLIWLLGVCCLLFNTGCHSIGVVAEEEPKYRHEPPPPAPHKPGPPPWAPAHGYRLKYRYHYYPSSYVYYDLGRRLYFYFDAGNWQVTVSLPAWIHIDINDYVTLEMNTGEPYEYHFSLTCLFAQ